MFQLRCFVHFLRFSDVLVVHECFDVLGLKGFFFSWVLGLWGFVLSGFNVSSVFR